MPADHGTPKAGDDERRAEIEALTDVFLSHVDFKGDRAFATLLAERCMRRLDRVRDARGDDEAAKLHRDGFHADAPVQGCALCDMGRLAARSPQDGDHGRTVRDVIRQADEIAAGYPQGEDHEAAFQFELPSPSEGHGAARRYVVRICPECGGQAYDGVAGHSGDCPNIHAEIFALKEIEVVPMSSSRDGSVAVEDVRAQTVAEIAAAVRAGSDAARPNEAKGWPRAADFIEREFSPASTGDQGSKEEDDEGRH